MSFGFRVWRLGRKGEDGFDNLLGGLADDLASAFRAVRHAHAAVQKTKVVVDLRDRRDDGTRIAAGRALLDGDRRGQSLNLLDIRLLHLVEELPRVRAQRLHVAPLPFGIERIERER